MTAREEKIKEAYGDYWVYFFSKNEAKKQALEHDGWVFVTYLPASFNKELFDFDHNGYICRPKSLKGIENNNGWTAILSEEDYKNLSSKCLVFTDKKNEYTYTHYCNSFTISETEKITHYRLIEKYKPPIY